MFKRRTSTYLVLIKSDNPNETLDRMREHCPAEINQSAVYTGMAGLRFRCESDDNVALNIALQIAAGRQFILRTGYGINQREVAQ